MPTGIKSFIVLGALLGASLAVTSAALAASGAGGMAMDQSAFKHEATVQAVKAEFQVMTLASMNMKDPAGATHHVMVKFFDAETDVPLEKAVGKIKIISPSRKEAVESLKDYNGIYAANFAFDEPGQYGIICLVKIEDKKLLYKFWFAFK